MKFFSIEHFEAIFFAVIIAIPAYGNASHGTLICISALCYGVAMSNIRCRELEKKLQESVKNNP